ELGLLEQDGFEPLGQVMGTCVYHVAHRGLLQSLRQMGRNAEMQNYTQALYSARELALARMQAEAEEGQAQGVVGTQGHEGNPGWGSLSCVQTRRRCQAACRPCPWIGPPMRSRRRRSPVGVGGRPRGSRAANPSAWCGRTVSRGRWEGHQCARL